MEKRAVVLFGAGASLDYKAPSTGQLTKTIENHVLSSDLLRMVGGDHAYISIRDGLVNYLERPGHVNFEQLFHCVHELINFFPPFGGSLDEYRPLLNPFLQQKNNFEKVSLRHLADEILRVIYDEVLVACNGNSVDLSPLAGFLNGLRDEYITRVYTTNYDDFPLQAVPDLYTGFPEGAGPSKFELNSFWDKEDVASIFHLHGSIHMGFPHPIPVDGGIGELFWYEDRNCASAQSRSHPSDDRRMDGSLYMRSPIITGLDKLTRLQQRPLTHFYSALARDLMKANVIFVIGSGLGDLHLNSLLKEARSRNPKPSIIFVDYWGGGFFESTRFEMGRKETEMFHALGIHVSDRYPPLTVGGGWTTAADRTAAVWDKGFQAFLGDPAALQRVMGTIV